MVVLPLEPVTATIGAMVNQLANSISLMTGIPVNKVASHELKKLSEMKENIQHNIIGQNEAIEKVVKSIRRNRVGLKDPNKPIGSFIFLGQDSITG